MIRVFPSRNKWTPNDELAFVGDPPLPMFRPPTQPLHVSVTFTWDIEEGYRLLDAWRPYYPDSQIGGPAFGDAGGEFEPGRYVKQGVVFTSRGCIRRCPFCFVPKREGKLRELQIKDGWIVQDNNLLACSRGHIERVFEMLRRQPIAATFSGGLDARLLSDWHRKLFDSIRISELWFACDTNRDIPALVRASSILNGIPTRKRRCYALIGLGTLAEDRERLERILSLGFMPFAQLYRTEIPNYYTKEWLELQREWSRPAIYKATHSNN